MLSRTVSFLVVICGVVTLPSCTGIAAQGVGEELVSLVDAKAVAVAEQIGGVGGFGGTMMSGYFDHAEQRIRFDSTDDLADPNAVMTIVLQNGSTQACSFHVAFIASYLGLDEQTEDAEVPAGDEATIEIPCSEMIGMGSLETPAATACQLADGRIVNNMMSVPAFLGLDYQCGQMYRLMLTSDANDVDGDGDTEELIVQSDALRMHLLIGGPMGHMHGAGQGMMGPHMGP